MAQTKPNLNNFISLAKSGLEKEVKKAITEQMVREQLKEYEVKLRETIKPIVESVAFKGVEGLKDAMRLREELHVFLHWDDEQETQVTREI